MRYYADKSKWILIFNICRSFYMESFMYHSKISMLQAFEALRESIEGMSLIGGRLFMCF